VSSDRDLEQGEACKSCEDKSVVFNYEKLLVDPDYIEMLNKRREVSAARRAEKLQETLTIEITKGINGWSSWVVDHEGNDMGGGTAPSFSEIYELTHQVITGDSGDYGDEHNVWVDYNANTRDNV
jgi:hypothetical protein